jgi:hypothetical protein
LHILFQRMLMTEFQLPYKALPHSEFEVVKDKLSQVARSIGQSANGTHHFLSPLLFTQFIADCLSNWVLGSVTE